MNLIQRSLQYDPLPGDGSHGNKGKTLILVRHAKSSWANDILSDFDRPLNDRGKNDAPKMARLLIEKNIPVDAFISSPAKRARKTAALFMKEFDRKEKEMILVPSLYEANTEAFYRTIHAVDNTFNSIALFSHNPGITYFANGLTAEVQVDDMPTCAMFAVRSDNKSWADFQIAEKQFLFFDYPKKVY